MLGCTPADKLLSLCCQTCDRAIGNRLIVVTTLYRVSYLYYSIILLNGRGPGHKWLLHSSDVNYARRRLQSRGRQ